MAPTIGAMIYTHAPWKATLEPHPPMRAAKRGPKSKNIICGKYVK